MYGPSLSSINKRARAKNDMHSPPVNSIQMRKQHSVFTLKKQSTNKENQSTDPCTKTASIVHLLSNTTTILKIHTTLRNKK